MAEMASRLAQAWNQAQKQSDAVARAGRLQCERVMSLQRHHRRVAATLLASSAHASASTVAAAALGEAKQAGA